jgi:hypothetical protein
MAVLGSLLVAAKGFVVTVDVGISALYIFALCALIVLVPWLLSALFLSSTALFRIGDRAVRILVAAGAVLWVELFYLICIIDVIVYRIIGVHIYSGFILDVFFNSAPMQNDIRLSAGTVISTVLFFSALLVANGFWYCFLSRAWPRLSDRANRLLRRAAGSISLMGVAAVTAIGVSLTHLTPFFLNNTGLEDVLPFYNADFHYFYRARSLPFHYPVPADASGYPALENRQNVLMVMVESYRADVLNDEVSPHLMNFAREHGIDMTGYHYAACHSTSCANYSYLSGLNSYTMDYLNTQRAPFYPLELLKKNGYALYGASASMLRFYSKHLTPILNGFDAYEEFLGPDGVDNERRMQAWIDELIHKKHPAGKPFFLFVFINATHHNYMFPPEFEKYTPVLPADYNHFMGSGKLKVHKEELINRYKNSALFVDSLFGGLTTIFRDELKSDSLVVSFAGDHSEEFWDNGSLGHARAKLVNARIRTPFLLYLPGAPPLNAPLSSHVDVLPTIIDYLRPAEGADLSRFFDGISLLRPPSSDRYLVVSSYGFPYINDNLALITADGILSLRKGEKSINAQNTFTPYAVTTLDEKPLAATPSSLLRAEELFKRDILRFFAVPTTK